MTSSLLDLVPWRTLLEPIEVSLSASDEISAAWTGRIWVIAYELSTSHAGATFQWESYDGDSVTKTGGAMLQGATTGALVRPWNLGGWFVTNAGDSLRAAISAGPWEGNLLLARSDA